MTFNKIFGFFYEVVRGRSFVFDDTISFSYLLTISLSNMFCLIRGFIFFRKMILVGRNVTVRAKNKFRFGVGVCISDNVFIDAMGVVGLSIGDRVSIGRSGFIKVSGTLSDIGYGISIGRDVGIGECCHIGGAGGLQIGDDTIIGAFFSAHPENHNYADPLTAIRLQGVNRVGIRIGSGCWIGAKVTILDGAIVGNNCVIAAGSVVRGDFPDGCVIGGVPAKIIKKIGV